MFEPMLESVISIDTENEIIHLYSRPGGGAEIVPVKANKTLEEQQEERKINYHVVSYKAAPYSDEFFTKFQEMIKQYREDFPNVPMQRVSVVLPDTSCLTDTITIPTMQKKMMENSVSAALANLYKEAPSFKFNRLIMQQNKQHTTYAVAAMKRDVLTKLNLACAALQIGVANVTYASATTTNAAMALNPKLKNATFVLVDVKDSVTNIILVVKGKTMGSFRLPYGYTILVDNVMIPEDMLFYHDYAEAEVADAKERAKAKNSADKKRARQEAADDDDEAEDDEESTERSYATADLPEFIRTDKEPRRLPRYMLRDVPDSSVGFVYENFRLIMKWVVDVVGANRKITSLDDNFKTVYVNLPESLNFVCEMANAEAGDKELRFEPLCETQGDEMIHRYLEFYGGFFAKQYNKINNF